MFAYLPHHHVCIPSMRHVRSSLYIHTSTHPHIYTSSHYTHPHYTHPHIYTPSLYTFTLFTLTSTHPHTIHTLTSTHPHSTHPHTSHILTSTHPHICTPSHYIMYLHIYTPTHPHTLNPHTAAEFISKLAAVEEQHAQQLNNVVKNFRRRTNETLRRESWVTRVEEWVGVVEECVWNEPCSRMWPTLSVVNYVGSLKSQNTVCAMIRNRTPQKTSVFK